MITQHDIARLSDADVYDTDGDKIGSVGQVYLDNTTGDPAWISVKTGLFGMKETFVPLQQATVSGDTITVAFGKDRVKDAPQIDADGQLSPAEETQLYAYYGLAPADGNPAADTYQTSNAFGEDHTEAPTATTDGHATDNGAMTRSEERLVTGTRTEQAGTARLRKYVVTEQQRVTVPVSHEEVRLEREPITAGNAGDAFDGPEISEAQHEVTLHAERPVVATETVPVERVRLGKETVHHEETVSGEVRKEQIEFDGPDGTDRH